MPKNKEELTEQQKKKRQLDEEEEDDDEEEDEDDEEEEESRQGITRPSSKNWDVKKKRVFLYGFRRTLINVGFKENITGSEGKREIYTLTSPDGKTKIVGYLKQNKVEIDGKTYEL